MDEPREGLRPYGPPDPNNRHTFSYRALRTRNFGPFQAGAGRKRRRRPGTGSRPRDW